MYFTKTNSIKVKAHFVQNYAKKTATFTWKPGNIEMRVLPHIMKMDKNELKLFAEIYVVNVFLHRKKKKVPLFKTVLFKYLKLIFSFKL